jgi:hypothetical protein
VTALLRLIFLVPTAFALACIAAALVAAIGLSRGFTVPPPEGGTAMVMVLATFGIATLAFLPMLLAIILAEVFAWRSVFYWLFVGAAIAFLAATPIAIAIMHAVTQIALVLAIDSSVTVYRVDWHGNVTIIALAAGFVGGAVYWLIAGRYSGVDGPGSAAPRSAPPQEP